ncbi:MAG: hypothetical protein ABH859_08220 [Pseudomonadota bacterium]
MLKVHQVASNQEMTNDQSLGSLPTSRQAREINCHLAYLGLISLINGQGIAESIDNYPDETFPNPQPNPEPINPNAPTIR